jgi:YHS domain-containing protein
MMIESSSAPAGGNYGGQTVYFCSVGCQKTYERTHRRST